MNQSDQALQNAINRSQEGVVKAASDIVQSLCSGMPIVGLDGRFVEWVDQLDRLVPLDASPKWLIAYHTQIDKGAVESEVTRQIGLFVVSNLPEIATPILIGEEASFNFDAMFVKERERLGIANYFERLIAQLEAIIAEDIVDQRVVLEAIQRLKAVLAMSRHGSLTAILMTMSYSRFVMKAFGGVLKANQITKPFYESFVAEFETASKAVEQAKTATECAAIRKLTNERRLEMFINEHPEVQSSIQGFLPPPEQSA